MTEFKKITACLDMYGCPNRCRHCWLGATPNGNLTVDDLKYAAKEFRPFTGVLEIADWYREPDYKDNYKEMWQLTSELSDTKTPHFENISIWRTTRDQEYVKWLSSLGVKAVQLTVFGNEETTDYNFGRSGVYNEILQSIDILLENRIAPRIQTFINKSNIHELSHILALIENLNLEKRCRDIGHDFDFFLHQGSCDGENEKFYDVWLTPEDVDLIPEKLIDFSLKHWKKSNIAEVLGCTEQDLYNELLSDNSTEDIISDMPVFYIDKDFNVYPNYETPSPYWCLGSLKTDGAKQVLENYIGNKSVAQHIRKTVPICEMVKKCGNPQSCRLFGKWDYKNYIHNRYCREL
jgi:MoaA/NifB/PqqE/SkfB family radical SAM enzyme